MVSDAELRTIGGSVMLCAEEAVIIYIGFFILFLLAAIVFAWILISEQADYTQASDYYSDMAASWVVPSRKAGSRDSDPAANASPAAVQTDAQAKDAAVPSESMELPDAEKPAGSGSDPIPAEAAGSWNTAGADENANESGAVQSADSGGSGAEAAGDASESSAAESIPADPDLIPPVSVDFEGLKQINPEIVGWIYCEDTQINFPVLHTNDNSKYLTKQPDGKTTKSGSIFSDCGCAPDFSSSNTIIYGHNRKNGMFSSLSKYSKQEYYEEHPVMWLLTPEMNYRVDLFAGFVTKPDGWVYRIDLPEGTAWDNFVAWCRKNSRFSPSCEPVPGDRFITLSTCNYTFDDARYALVGLLVPAAGQSVSND